MKNIKVLEYGRLDKESMEMITGGVKPVPGGDCAPSGCVVVGGTHYFHGQCAIYTQCGAGYQNCSSEDAFTQCAGGISTIYWFQDAAPCDNYTGLTLSV